MATVVFLHAHPDDESISTGGSIARLVHEGHRVVLVVATNGDHGEVPEDLADGDTLVDIRRRETEQSCAVLGIHRLAWLGYSDSGMTGWEQNSFPNAFMNANLNEAAQRVIAIVDEENADVLVGYDWHGGYGHPDHIMVHKVVHAVAELRPRVRVLEATMNRDRVRQRMTAAREMGLMSEEDAWDVDGPADDGNPMGLPEAELTHRVDVAEFVDLKRRAIESHKSQITDTGWFAKMPDEAFRAAFGSEWYRKVGDSGPVRDGWLL